MIVALVKSGVDVAASSAAGLLKSLLPHFSVSTGLLTCFCSAWMYQALASASSRLRVSAIASFTFSKPSCWFQPPGGWVKA